MERVANARGSNGAQSRGTLGLLSELRLSYGAILHFELMNVADTHGGSTLQKSLYAPGRVCTLLLFCSAISEDSMTSLSETTHLLVLS